MLPKRALLFFAYLFFCFQTRAQVNLQTGSAVFSLPIFNWQDDKSRLYSIIALSYSSGNGLRVNDVASNVGQGWSLVAGGVITRIQVGEPDDQVAHGNVIESDLTKYPSGILYASVPPENGCPEALRKYPIYKSRNQLYKQHNVVAQDRELDYFAFQFNGKAGMFVLDPANIGICHSLGDTKLKITFQQDPNLQNQGIRTRITSFTIHDVDGLIYKFSLHGKTKVLESKYCDKTLTRELTQPKFSGGGVYNQAGFENSQIVRPWVINNWYLSEIEDALTQRKIYFNYTTRNINHLAGRDITYNLSGTYNQYLNRGYAIISHKISKTQTPAITSIVLPDGHTVTFGYGSHRFDMTGDYTLASVDITYQGRFLSKHLLNTTYFIKTRYGTPVTDYQKSVARLCLKSIQKIGVDLRENTPPYIFDYYMGSNNPDDFVPPPFFYAKDIWGFYNGNNSVGYHNNTIPLNSETNELNVYQLKGLCFRNENVSGVVLNPKNGYAKNGLLRQIIYPTGGSLTYHYEQNKAYQGGSNVMWGGVNVSQTSSTDGGHSNGCNNPITTKYHYVINNPGSASSLWGFEMPVNSMTMESHYQPANKKFKWSLSCLLGCCYWIYQYPGILSMQEAMDLNSFQKTMETLAPFLNILSFLSTVNDIAALLASSPPGPQTVIAVVIEVIVSLVTLAVTCIGDQSRDKITTSYFNFDLNAVSPLPAQYKRVEIIEDPGTIGKTVQEFTSSDEYPVWELTNPYYSAKQRFAPWAYGLPKSTSVFNASGNKIKEVINYYDTTYAKSILNPCNLHPGLPPCNPSGLYTTLVSCKCLVVKTTSQRNTDWSNPSQYNSIYHTSSSNELKVDYNGLYTGRINLANSIERIFKDNDPSKFVETLTSYSYNNGNTNYDPNMISTSNSHGDALFKWITYSSDYTGSPLSTLVQNNIVSLPVTTRQTIMKAGTYTQQLLNEQVTEFIQIANGDIRPYRTIEQRITQPATNYNLYQGPGSNISHYNITQMLNYDASGNLITLQDEGGRIISNIYGYNDKYVIAAIINADLVQDNCAYAGFETDALWSGWTLQGTPAYNTSSSITGSASFILSASTSFTSPLNTSKSYTLSFWASNSSTQVNITGGTATLLKSAPALHGFTYYEYSISLGASSVTVTGGNSYIDELRLYPQNARMRTVTYDPLIGKTSECDENNRVTYYEYDNLGRLRFIKDEYRNIVKMYEYNNVSEAKQNGCPGIYFNRFISEKFTKECGSGFIGSTVTYSVPANMFSSAISQADADAKAEHYLLTNGQVYANANGYCIQIYYNTLQSQDFITENCPEGYIGGIVTYTVPAYTYSSTVSLQDANQMALDEIEANGQAYANDPANVVCNIDTNPHWEWEFGGAMQCQVVNGVLHLFLLATDVNPNSPSFGQTSWQDSGPNPEECPCTTTNCTGEGWKCVNGVCEQGIKVYTSSVYISHHYYECTYHYEWSDGSWSQNYIEYSPYHCIILN